MTIERLNVAQPRDRTARAQGIASDHEHDSYYKSEVRAHRSHGQPQSRTVHQVAGVSTIVFRAIDPTTEYSK